MGSPDIIAPSTTSGGTPVGGSGTPGTIPVWSSGTTLGDSIVTQTGTSRVNIGSGGYAGASVDGLRLVNGANSYIAASDGTRTLLMGANGAQVLVGSLTNHALVLKTNNIDAVTILPGAAGVGGNVGIGTTSPGYRLDVAASSGFIAAQFKSQYAGLARIGTDASQAWFGQGTNGINTSFIVNDTTGTATIQTSGSPQVTVLSGGNVGIGTASPQEKAQVSGNLKVGVTASDSFITFGDEGTTSRFNGIYRPASSNTMAIGSYNLITFNVSAANLGSQTERARIDSSGRLLVGTASSPAYSSVKLVVNSAGGVNQYLYDSGSSRGIYTNAYNSGGSGILEIGGVSGALGSESLATYMRISSTVIDASLVSGYGLKLPATPGATGAGTEQILDCYAEGTWTPTPAGFVTTAPSTVSGSYTRVGRLVTLNVYIYAGGSSFGSTLGTTTITVPTGMTPNFNGVGHGGVSRTTGTVAQCIAYYDGKVYIGTTASAATEMWVSVTYYV